GRYVAFASVATNLLGDGVGGFHFVRDRVTGITERVGVGLNGVQDNSSGPPFGTFYPIISADGRFMAFCSNASNLCNPADSTCAGGDSNGLSDVFVRGLAPVDPINGDPLGVDALLFPDGELDDTVLEVVDAVSGAITTLCPADAVSVSNGNA